MRPLPPKLIDQGVMATWLNWLRDCVADRTPQRSFNSRMSAGKGGFRTTPRTDDAISSSGSTVELYQIVAIGNDTLSARAITFDETTGAKVLSTTIDTIAKPYYLRVSPTNGTTVGGGVISFPDPNTKRTTYATLQGVANVVINKSLTPPYVVGDEIWAVDGDTSVATGTAPDLVRVTLEDLNVDAREWLFPERFVKVCVNGATLNMVVYGSAPF